jgi:hypothetical protein
MKHLSPQARAYFQGLRALRGIWGEDPIHISIMPKLKLYSYLHVSSPPVRKILVATVNF